MSRPNIIYMHSHDTGRYVQPYGHAIATPHIQKFAEQGVLFRQAFCCGPTCSPSRAALLFGQSPHSCGMLGLSNLGWPIRDMSQHLQNTLKRAGYTTALCGTQHIAQRDAKEIGYDQNVAGAHKDLVGAATAWLRQPKDKPFFLSLGHGLTHRHGYLPPTESENPAYIAPPTPMPDLPAVRQDMAAFHASCKQLDRDWGRVLAVLDETALADNTLVILTTDHGIGFPDMKCHLFDGGLGVMLILRGPGGFDGGEVFDALVSHVDIYPTICELIGIDLPAWLQGVSLMPLVRGEAESVRDEIFGEITYHVSYQPERCVRTHRYKYIRRFYDRLLPTQPNIDDGITKSLWQAHGWGDLPLPADALYDLVFDPCETNNLALDPRYADTLADMRRRLDRWMRDTNDPLLKGPVPRPSGGRIIEADQLSNTGPWIDLP